MPANVDVRLALILLMLMPVAQTIDNVDSQTFTTISAMDFVTPALRPNCVNQQSITRMVESFSTALRHIHIITGHSHSCSIFEAMAPTVVHCHSEDNFIPGLTFAAVHRYLGDLPRRAMWTREAQRRCPQGP